MPKQLFRSGKQQQQQQWKMWSQSVVINKHGTGSEGGQLLYGEVKAKGKAAMECQRQGGWGQSSFYNGMT